MDLRAACSIFTGGAVALVLAGCSMGDGVCWLPGGTGSCPSGGDDDGPSYHSYSEPQLMKRAGAFSLLMMSADDADQEEGYVGDTREEIALPLPTDGTVPQANNTDLPDGYPPTIACSDVCLAAWNTEQDPTAAVAIRDASGWSASAVFEPAIHSPVAATFGDVLLVAWAAWVEDVGARIELRRLDRSANVTGSWTLAAGASDGHLSLTATAIGGLVTWERVQPNADDTSASVWVDAQLLDATGAPDGASLELAIPSADDDYYHGAPTAFADGVYHVVHGGLGDGVPWFVVDPTARTIALDPVAGLLPGPIQQITPLADGYALSVGDITGGVAHVVGGQLVQTLPLAGPATIAPTADGGVTAAYAYDGSVYLSAIPPDFGAAGSAEVVAARYQR